MEWVVFVHNIGHVLVDSDKMRGKRMDRKKRSHSNRRERERAQREMRARLVQA